MLDRLVVHRSGLDVGGLDVADDGREGDFGVGDGVEVTHHVLGEGEPL